MKLDLSKINPWVAGITLISGGSILIYLEGYKNNEWLGFLAYGSVFIGWIIIFIRATKNTSVGAKKIFFKDDKGGWFKQGLSNLFFYLVLIALIGGNLLYITNKADKRKNEILDNGPVGTTVAEVTGIDVRRSRRSTSYYAIFEYTVNGKTIKHPRYEANEFDFIIGQKYEIRYSVEYPEMFRLLTKL